ncbi:hypothetical protein Bsph_2874 [Lysinibacillus sphaericus C3-41]|uniref:Uncharacterized protein n=1 Tax=Lysinibacillus sphaericus (strain C3-41) TaxID=444177 RepID=B1HMN9_LYSSC|nr:hypothetical protein [Lysinibacillus sphaericus]ACA40405.1 hypothetical protein Bsph_2874 [Lysinibacillus sphaericus C3-41]
MVDTSGNSSRQHLAESGKIRVFLKTEGKLDIYAKTYYRDLNSYEFNRRAIL